MLYLPSIEMRSTFYVILVSLSTVYGTICPDIISRLFPCDSGSSVRCYELFEAEPTFVSNRDEAITRCNGYFANGDGSLLQFVNGCEFERLKSILEAIEDDSITYLTGLIYNSAGQLVDSSNDPVAAGRLPGTTLSLTDPGSADQCVAIRGGTMPDLVVVNCDQALPYVCSLELNEVPIPTIMPTEDRLYVGSTEELRLTCSYTSTASRSATKWFVDGMELSTSSSVTIDTDTTSSVLTISPFDPSAHTGSYQCVNEGILGNLITRTVHVSDAVVPVISKQPQDLSADNRPVYQGGIAFFDCLYSEGTRPKPSVTWFRNNVEIDVASNPNKYFLNERTNRLFISNVQNGDETNYHCMLTNKEGSVRSDTATLSVLSTPSLSSVPPPTTLLHPSGDGSFSHLLGTTLVIEAVHNATPNLVTYDWTYNPGRSNSLQYDDNVNFGHLILENPQLINSGEFKLTLRLPGQAMDGSPLNSETPFSVVVQVESVPEITAVNTVNTTVQLGSSVTFTCSYQGKPEPTVQWLKDNEAIVATDSKYQFDKNFDTNTWMGTHMLTVVNIQPSELGTYQCFISSTRGSDIDSVFITGRPGLPGIVVPTVESFSVDSVRVTWDPPAEPNEDIELLTYIVYVLVRDLGTQDNIDPDSLGTRDQDFVRPWDRREALLSSGLDENKQVVAIVVAESAQGLGAVGKEAFGNTFGRRPTSAPGSVTVSRSDGGVRVGWDEIVGPRSQFGIEDVTFYEVEYFILQCHNPEPPFTSMQADSRDEYFINSPVDENTIVYARVRGVAQVRVDPVVTQAGPWSDVVIEDNKTCPPAFPTLAVALGVVVPVVLIILIVFIVIVLLLYWNDRRLRGRYFPGKAEKNTVSLGRELNGTGGWDDDNSDNLKKQDNSV